MAEFSVPTNFRPTQNARTRGQALKEGLLNAPFYAATWPLMAYDLGESAVDALRGTSSPNRMTQAASALKQLFGGEAIPQEYERGVEPWDVTKYDVAGSLPAATINPLRAVRELPKNVARAAQDFARANVPAHVVKPKGGNWLSGSVEDALSGLKRASLEDVGGLNIPDSSAKNPLNDWIEGPLTKYVKTRMATPDDEVRKLAEQGVLHFEPAMIRERSPLMEKIVGRRETAGFPIQGVADAPLARNWENTSDSIIRNLEARDISSAERAASFSGKSNIPGDTIIHEMNPFASGAGISDLGFPHLIDELRNAANPNSGLPKHLQLTPEAMQNLSMEKAVRRVADINAWRAAQKAEANQKFGLLPPLVREYAENNPKGLRWLELKAGDKVPDELPVGWQRKGDNLIDPEGLYHGIAGKPGSADRAFLEKQLAAQLKYEGDTMGHCVGGYCDDVLSGRSRIFSLRDAKGEPHVTVEVAPGNPTLTMREALIKAHERGEYGNNEDELMRIADRVLSETAEPPRIVQIKGKANRKPNDGYLPFVQDFVRNPHLGQPWSDVGDLGNTGLIHAERAGVPKDLFKSSSPYLTKEEYDALVAENVKAAGFAHGGTVRPVPRPGEDTMTIGTRGLSAPTPDIQGIISALKEYHANA